jgi:hypothetical protein
MAGLDAFQKLLIKAATKMPDKVTRIIQVEGNNFIKKNFKDEAFTDTTAKKWKARKTKDKRGRDITRYRTNRVGRAGALNRYGSKNKGRAILVGHGSGGNKLRNSFKSKRKRNQVAFYTYKKYAQRHNEGKDGMPRRQFMGKSAYLNNRIATKTKKELDKLMN